VSVRALVLDGADVVAVENVAGPGKLHMPGGGVEHGETMLDALRRELWEEIRIGAASAEYLLAIENMFDTPLGVFHGIEHVFRVSPDGVPDAGEAELTIHRLPLATIGQAPFYPTAFRNLLAQPDWLSHRHMLAGKFIGEN